MTTKEKGGSVMNLTELFEVQRKLDAEIERKHPTAPGEDRLAKRILALQVELAECANEWRGFKFWSMDHEPRNYCATCQLTETPHVHKNPLLEEYVDSLHFILSIGLDVGIDDFNLSGKSPMPKTITHKFSMIYKSISNFEDMYYMQGKDRVEFKFVVMLNDFISLGEMLGFTWNEIETAYYAKNKINHKRQETGY